MRQLIKTFILLLFIISNNNLFSKDPYPKNPNIDILNYSFELHLNDSNNIIYGEANISLNIKPSEKNVRLDLISQNNSGNGMAVKKVLFNGNEISYSHLNDEININTENVKYSSSDVITIKYSGIPITGLIIGPNMHGDRTFLVIIGQIKLETGFL